MTKKEVTKAIQEMSPTELEEMAAQVEARQKAVREQLEREQLDRISVTAKEAAEALGWTKLPRLMLTANEAGDGYAVDIVTGKPRGSADGGTRAKSDPNTGDITIKKLGIPHGGIASLRDKEGHEYKGLKELVMSLRQPDGKPEADRCYDIVHKGIAASDIVINHHAEDVTLVFNDGTTKLVKDAVEEAKAARAAAN